MSLPDQCPCGTGLSYDECCGIFHQGEDSAETALQLMRSRYSAFATCKIDYLRDTLWPPKQKQFDPQAFEMRSRNSVWLGLKIIETQEGSPNDTRGKVHFIASSLIGGNLDQMEERSLFRKKNGRWYYVGAE